MEYAQELVLKVGEWWVRPQLRELERNETKLRIETRSMDVLLCLARQPGEVVPKERILDEVWGESFVGEEVISHAIWELRKAFADDAREPRYIETVPRSGYRLVAEVFRPAGSPVPVEGAQIEHYEITRELGRGAMGVVYQAFDQRLRRTVALKFLASDLTGDENARRRFQREARLAASLDHPHLATVYEIGETSGGRQFIVTAFYGGGSLRERLAAGPMSWSETIDLGRRLASGLEEAHRHGIIHRDVNPGNVLLADDGTPKLADFGIAKLLGATSLTRSGASLGTPAYKSPEQSRNEEVDHRTDIWSLGVVLYEALTGRRPFRGENWAVLRSILEEEPEDLASGARQPVPENLRRVVLKAMAKRPEDRYQSAAEMAEDLKRCRQGVAVGSAHRWTPWAVASSLAVAAALAALLALDPLSWRRDRPGGDVNPEVVRLLDQGDHYERRGDDLESLVAAESAYRDALGIAPDHPDALARLALVMVLRYVQVQSPELLGEIRQRVEQSLAADPELPVAWMARARLSLAEGAAGEAVTEARRAVALDPEDDRGYCILGEALFELGETQESLRQLRRGTELGLGHIRTRRVLARKLWDMGDVNQAAVEYEKILDYAPDHPTALNNLGILYLQMNRNLEALRIFRQLFEKRKDFRFANNMGTALFHLQRWDEAVAAFTEAHALAPASPSAAVGLGDTYWARGEPARAREWFAIALESYDRMLEEGSVPISRVAQRAVCLAKLQRFEDAYREIERAMEAQPSRGLLLFYAAQIRALAADREGLYQYARQAVAAGYSPEDFLKDPSFWPFREDAEFQVALEGR